VQRQRIVDRLSDKDPLLDSETSSTRASSDTEIGEALLPPPPPPPPPCGCGCEDIAAPSTEDIAVDSDDAIEMLELARGCKDMAAQLFKQGRFHEAQREYEAAWEVLDASSGFPEELKPAADDLKLASYLNSAACFLRLGDHTLAQECCDNVLHSEPFNEKALFRRASALIGLGRDTDALSDLQLLLEHYPNNSEARRLLPRVERRVHQVQKKEKSMYLKMFADLGSNAQAEVSSHRTRIHESAEGA
jgi:tetratricopeptide (TPR) repeat protein